MKSSGSPDRVQLIGPYLSVVAGLGWIGLWLWGGRESTASLALGVVVLVGGLIAVWLFHREASRAEFLASPEEDA